VVWNITRQKEGRGHLHLSVGERRTESSKGGTGAGGGAETVTEKSQREEKISTMSAVAEGVFIENADGDNR